MHMPIFYKVWLKLLDFSLYLIVNEHNIVHNADALPDNCM